MQIVENKLNQIDSIRNDIGWLRKVEANIKISKIKRNDGDLLKSLLQEKLS